MHIRMIEDRAVKLSSGRSVHYRAGGGKDGTYLVNKKLGDELIEAKVAEAADAPADEPPSQE